MNFRLFILGAALAVAPLLVSAQKEKPATYPSSMVVEQLKAAEDTLAILAFAVINDSIEQERFAACRQLITRLSRTLKTENSFKYPFERLRSISILYPPHSTFRVFTWQLFINDSTYRYYGAIQRNTAQISLIPLIDRSDDMDIILPVHEVLPPDRWYGALYYGIRQFDTKKGRKYLLMGYDAYTFFEKRKVVDVLSFDEKKQPQFGAAVFERETPRPGGPELRLFLEYSAEASVRCNWDEVYQMVLMEHLMPMPSPFGRGMSNVPDGSYDGLLPAKGGIWKIKEKVFDDKQSEAPSVIPASTDKSKDIFGKTKGAKKEKKKP